MCEPADAIRVLENVKFTILSIPEILTDNGSHKRAIAKAVAIGICCDIDYCVAQITAERKTKNVR